MIKSLGQKRQVTIRIIGFLAGIPALTILLCLGNKWAFAIFTPDDEVVRAYECEKQQTPFFVDFTDLAVKTVYPTSTNHDRFEVKVKTVVSRNPWLKNLSLNLSRMTNAGLANLKPLAKLKSLYVCGYNQMATDLSFLANFPELEWLKLDIRPFNFNGLDTLGKLSKLRYLSIVGPPRTHYLSASNAETPRSQYKLSFLNNLQQLHCLELQSIIATPKEFCVLGTLPNLECLDLSYTNIDDLGFTRILALPNLKKLVAARTDIALLNCDPLTKFPRSELRTLNLAGSLIDDRSIIALSELRSLEELVLDRTKVTGRTLGLLSHSSIKRLFLSGSNLNDDGAKEISKLTSIKELYIVDTSIGDRGIASITALPNLEKLHAEINNLTPFGLLSFANCHHLRKLWLPAWCEFCQPLIKLLLPECAVRFQPTNC